MVNTLLSSTPTMRFSIEEVLEHPWLDDSQMKSDIEVLQKAVELHYRNVKDENVIQVIRETQESSHSDKIDKKRKLPFSVPEFLGKRLKT